MTDPYPDPKQITSANEEYVRQWFELSGFTSTRLDSYDGKKGKNADWKFSKSDLDIICEVKTIFSGGQSGLNETQWNRNRLQEKNKLDDAIARLPKDEKLIGTKDYFDWVNGKTVYPKESIRKEGVEGARGTYKDFKKILKSDLLANQEIRNLPFDITLSISGLYVPNSAQYKEFFDWLKGFVIWANQNRNLGPFYPSSSFKFDPDTRTAEGHFVYGAEALAQIWGPTNVQNLEVGFIEGGTPYNEDSITSTIQDAIAQIRASRTNNDNLEQAKSVIGFWSESSSLSFQMLLFSDVIDAQLGELPKRYTLFDWAFSQYSDELTAIALFELRPPKGTDFGELLDINQLTPTACLILNPFVPQAEILLRNAINEKHCSFIKGIGSDPLAAKDKG